MTASIIVWKLGTENIKGAPTMMASNSRYQHLLLLVLAMTMFVMGQSPGGDDLDSLIDYVFTSPPPPENNIEMGCECVPYYLCENNTIITDGSGAIDIRFKDEACPNFLEVCCQDPLLHPPTPIPTELPIGCGRRNPEGVGFRITGGFDGESQFGEFPWMIAILNVEEDDTPEGPTSRYVYQCGGSLIHPNVVLTTAHCVAGKQAEYLTVRAGEWDTQTKNELYGHKDSSVSSIVMHENYYAGALYNDVALLFLSQPIEQAENIGFVCLPEQGQLPNPNTRCFASGWGKDVYGKAGKYQVILKKVDLPVVARDQCVQALRSTRLGSRFKLHSSFMCAGGEKGKDTCKGDGGSPLVCPIPGKPGRFYQSGMVAWGIGCGENRIPGVYASVAQFRNWIDRQMEYNNLDKKYYKFS